MDYKSSLDICIHKEIKNQMKKFFLSDVEKSVFFVDVDSIKSTVWQTLILHNHVSIKVHSTKFKIKIQRFQFFIIWIFSNLHIIIYVTDEAGIPNDSRAFYKSKI